MSRFVITTEAGDKKTPVAFGGFKIIYVDPPWSYNDAGTEGGVGHEYKTMTFHEMAALPIDTLAAENCAMFMWATRPRIEEALALIRAWGFEYVTEAFTWVKTRGTNVDGSGKPFLGLGHTTRANTEPVLYARRGKPKRVDASVSQVVIDNELITAELGRHSAKPPEVRDRIVKLMGDVARVELFARDAAPRWFGWGNQYPTPAGQPTLTLE